MIRPLVSLLLLLALLGCSELEGAPGGSDGGGAAGGATGGGGSGAGGSGATGVGGSSVSGPGDVPQGSFDPDPTNSDGVSETPSGELVLDQTVVNTSFAWIANTDESTVSKLDTTLLREVARYPSIRPFQPGQSPSRTAVDGNGDVWIANRAFGGQGTVTKIANVACPDRDGDGVLTTSHDANGDGRIDLGSPVEFPGDRDECVLFTVPVGVGASIPRALALDAGGIEGTEGSAWVGLFGSRQLVKLRNSDGVALQTVDLPFYDGRPDLGRMEPYGAAIDGRGRIWMTTIPPPYGNSAGIAWVDAATGQASEFLRMPTDLVPVNGTGPLGCRGTYGIAVDEKDRVWVGGWGCAAVFRYDPATAQWAAALVPGGDGLSRGVAVERRKDGGGEFTSSRVWAAFSESPTLLVSLDAETMGDAQVVRMEGMTAGIGVGLDDRGRVWVVNNGSADAGVYDPATGRSDRIAVGPAPYTYSDFTGYARRNFTAPRGSYRRLFSPDCLGEKAVWKRLEWSGATPARTRIELSLRVADEPALLPGAPRFGPFVQTSAGSDSPVDLTTLGVPDARHALVEVVLSSEDGAGSPTLQDFRLVWGCAEPELQ